MVSQSASITSLNTSLKEFFFHWVMFTRPMHNLTLKESEVLAALLHKRYELSKAIINEMILNKFLFSKEIKETIVNESGIKSTDFSNALSRLRKKDVIGAGNLIDPRFIPNLKFSSNRFDFLIMFNITDNEDNISDIGIKEEIKPVKHVTSKVEETKEEEVNEEAVVEGEIFEAPEDTPTTPNSKESYEEKMKRMFSETPPGEADLGNVGMMERRPLDD